MEISTPFLFLTYKKEEPFNRSSLMIKMSTQSISGTGVWRYGFEENGNYLGTARTLDGQDGKTELEKGLLSREGYTVFDDSKTMVFNEECWMASRIEGNTDLYFFGYGHDFKGCIRDFYKVSGATPLLPRYALGNWWSRYWEYSEEELKELIEAFESRHIPLSVCILDMDWHVTTIDEKYGSGWTGYTWNNELFKNPKDFLEYLKSKNLHTSLNLHPALGIRASEACYEEVASYMEVNKDAEEMVPFDPADPKFMNAYFNLVHHPHEEIGVDFWWIDWQQGNTTAIEGLDPLWMLNHYHFMDHGRDKEKRPFIFSRWPGLGGHRYPIGFSGDTVVSWDTLAYQPEFTMTAANVGYGWWSHDIGGHYFGHEDGELYLRWLQYGVFSPIMRLHTSKNYYNKREPWRHSKEIEDVATTFMQLRHQMMPYLYAMNHHNASYGMPIVTPMYYEYPDAYDAYAINDQYFFGTELMVAPFLAPMDRKLNQAERKVWFPEGDWFDYFDGSYYPGDSIQKVYGNLEKMPVFAKKGAIIPKGELQTGHGVENPKGLIIDIFPGEDNEFVIYEDDGISRDYETGTYHETIISTTYESNQLTIQIELRGDKQVIPKERQAYIHLRSFSKDIQILGQSVNGVAYIGETKTHRIELGSLDTITTINVIFNKEIIDKSYDYVIAIMQLVDHTTYATAYKEKIGFVYPKYNREKRGILAMHKTIQEKALMIVAQDLPQKLKEAVMTLLLRGSDSA